MIKEGSIKAWALENRDMAIEALRIYLGIALLLKGVQFAVNHEIAQEYLGQINIPAIDFFSFHVLVVVHLAGGILLTIGLITRIAALIQIPLLFGAIFFVHMQQGLFTRSQNLEFVILVLVLLLVFSVYGGGRFSVDGILEKRQQK